MQKRKNHNGFSQALEQVVENPSLETVKTCQDMTVVQQPEQPILANPSLTRAVGLITRGPFQPQ